MMKRSGLASHRAAAGIGAIRCLCLAVLTVSCLGFGLPASAGSRSYGEVTVNVEPPPQAASNYGYAVYHLTVSNRGTTAKTVTVTLPGNSWSYGDNISRLSRTVRVEPNSTASAEFLQPALPMEGDGARVRIDGKWQDEMVPVSIVSHGDYYDAGNPILISRGAIGPVSTRFEAMVPDSGSYEYERPGTWGAAEAAADVAFDDSETWYGTPPQLARANRPVGEWSGNWLAYSSYLAVMLTSDELREASTEVNQGLRDYVAAGGTLVVLGRGAEIGQIDRGWNDAASSFDSAASANELMIGLGRVYLRATDALANYSRSNWENFIRQIEQDNRHRVARMDAPGAERHLPMLEALTVPTRGLLTLMLLFTLIIGPANLVILSWLKKRMWLLWTVPTIAAVFAGGVLVYSLLHEGIQPRAKTVSVTLLDQTTRQAVTLGMTGYYAPLTPGDGLRFSDRTQITPQNGNHDYYDYGYRRHEGRSRTMDVTQGQHLSQGWIVARVPAHFELRTVEARRERLDITAQDDGTLVVVNGLGLPIKRLLIADDEGRQFEVGALAAGASGIAEPIATRQPSSEEWQSPEVVFRQRGNARDLVGRLHRDPQAYLSDNRYIALLDNASLTDPGLPGLGEHETTGAIVGRWKGGE